MSRHILETFIERKENINEKLSSLFPYRKGKFLSLPHMSHVPVIFDHLTFTCNFWPCLSHFSENSWRTPRKYGLSHVAWVLRRPRTPSSAPTWALGVSFYLGRLSRAFSASSLGGVWKTWLVLEFTEHLACDSCFSGLDVWLHLHEEMWLKVLWLVVLTTSLHLRLRYLQLNEIPANSISCCEMISTVLVTPIPPRSYYTFVS